MLCPKCTTENTTHAAFCINCHEHFVNMPGTTSDKGQQSSIKIDLSETPVPNIERVTEEASRHSRIYEKPAVSLGLNIAIIFGTIIFPIIGIAMGYTYMRKDHPDAKRVGRNWLMLGVIMFVTTILLVNLSK
ncbi:MAG: hypothetical protein KBA82_00145 [Nitrosomonas sp.]|nr:hypothetical protein [Nitrosomonas sp.]MBP7111410.1 hypothetical protein [Nitrosomonas sp.]